MAIIGIDLGTTNSLAAVYQNGKSVLIPNALGEVLTPSAVSLGDDGTILVGRAARERLITHPDVSVTSFKRSMGSDAVYTLAGRRFTPEELSSFVLRRLREDAQAFLGEPVEEAVISVLAYFSDSQRAATKRAGLLAGLRVERLINEPSAAALACRGAAGGDTCFLVFDFGGGTLDVSVVECFENVVNILAVCGDNRLGGDDFDEAIARLFCEKNQLDYAALSPSFRAILLGQAEQCKRALSDAGLAVMVVETPGISGTMTLNGQTLIEQCDQLFLRMRTPLHRALADCGLSPDELAAVIPVGGSCKMPVVRQYLSHLLSKPLLQPGSPDTVVALGAGLYAAMKERADGVQEMVLTDICPFTLGINNYNAAQPDRPFLAPIIERNSALPCSKTKRFFTVSDQQTQILVRIYQGESLYAEENLFLGEIRTAVPPASAGKEGVDVRFTYDINGILEAEVTSCTTHETKRAVLVGQRSGLSEAQAQARLAQLQKLKIHPRELEENTVLLARAQRIYAEGLGSLREAVGTATEQFERVLETQESARIARARRNFAAFLDRAQEGMDTDNFLFDPDAED